MSSHRAFSEVHVEAFAVEGLGFECSLALIFRPQKNMPARFVGSVFQHPWNAQVFQSLPAVDHRFPAKSL